MLKSINNQRYYAGYKINSNLDYQFNKNHLEKIVAVLNQARQTMVKPVTAHYCIYILKDFDITTLMPRIKRVLKDVPLMFTYTVEKSYRLHIHLLLTLETKDYADPDVLFIGTVLPAIKKLKNLMRSR